jgi:hypothetical protein
MPELIRITYTSTVDARARPDHLKFDGSRAEKITDIPVSV